MTSVPDQASRSGPGIRALLSRPAAVFWVFLVVYLFTWAGHYTSGDGAIKVDWARGILFRHSSRLDPAIGGGLEYSIYPIGHTLLAMPPLAASHLVHSFLGVRCEAALYTLLFILNGAFFLYLVARYLWPLHPPRRVWATAAILGLATYWWPYTKLDFTEPLVLTVLFGAFLLLRAGRTFAGMLVAGVGWTLRPDALLFAALLGAWQLWRTRRWQEALVMAGALAPAGMLNMAANYLRWGTLTNTGYAQVPGFDYPFLAGLFGILLSPGKGLVWFSPPLLLGLLGWRRFRAREATRADAVLFAALFLLSLGLYACWWDWGSDDAWGVRFLVPGVLLMTIPVVELLDRRRLVAGFFVVGVAVQLLALVLPPLEYVVMIRGSEGVRPAVYGFSGQRRVDLEDMWFHPRYGQLLGHWTLLRVLVGLPPQARAERASRTTGLALYECFPPEVWRQHASPDFIWWPRRGETPAVGEGEDRPVKP